jgi:hypothetical protein
MELSFDKTNHPAIYQKYLRLSVGAKSGPFLTHHNYIIITTIIPNTSSFGRRYIYRLKPSRIFIVQVLDLLLVYIFFEDLNKSSRLLLPRF